jgi:hypothetical protein
MKSGKTTKVYARPLRTRALVSRLRKEPNELKRKMLLLGYITDRLERKSEMVYLVGGQAVETYTAGQFTTGDIDITTTDRKATEEVLARIGFTREGMVWISEAIGVAVHIVDSLPRRSEKARLIEVGPYTVRVVGVEDLIIDRLAAAKHWKSQRDREQAKALLDSFKNQIDIQYLRNRAREEGVDDILSLLDYISSLPPNEELAVKVEKVLGKRSSTRLRAKGRERKTLRKSQRGSLPRLKSLVREKHDRFD